MIFSAMSVLRRTPGIDGRQCSIRQSKPQEPALRIEAIATLCSDSSRRKGHLRVRRAFDAADEGGPELRQDRNPDSGSARPAARQARKRRSRL
jgi:hypothetical protein